MSAEEATRGSRKRSREEAEENVTSPPPYLGEGASQHFLKLADVVFVVSKDGEKKDLLAHSQIIARCSSVLAPLLALAAEGALQPSEAGAGAAILPRELLRVEEPLKGYSEEAVTTFLTFAYDQHSAAAAAKVKAAIAEKGWTQLRELVRLLDQLGAESLLRALDGILVECLTADAAVVDDWLPLLVLADEHSQQLQLLRRATLVLASRAAVASLDAKEGGARPMQQFLGSKEASGLSQATLLSILASLVSGARTVQLSSLSTQQSSSLGRALSSWGGADPLLDSNSLPVRGSYTVTYTPDFSLAHKAVQHSDVFEIGGLKWKLLVYPNGNKNVDNMSIYLGAGQSRTGKQQDAYWVMAFSISILSSAAGIDAKTLEMGLLKCEIAGATGWGWPDSIKLQELRDPAKGYLVDGKMRVKVDITHALVLDM